MTRSSSTAPAVSSIPSNCVNNSSSSALWSLRKFASVAWLIVRNPHNHINAGSCPMSCSTWRDELTPSLQAHPKMATTSRGSSAACPAAPSCETIFPRRRLRSMRPVRSQIARTLSSPPARFSTQSDTNADWSRSIGLILGALGRDSIRFSAVPAPSSSSISIGCCSINSEANSSGAPLRRFKHFCQKCLNHQSFYSFYRRVSLDVGEGFFDYFSCHDGRPLGPAVVQECDVHVVQTER